MIRNLVEEHVQVSYDALRGNFPAFCGCEYCRDDIFVFALNRVPPRYVASLEGQVVTEVNLEKQQKRAEIDVVVMDLELGTADGTSIAARLLSANPSLRIAFFTSGSSAPVLERAQAIGPVFAKPDELEQLIAWIRA